MKRKVHALFHFACSSVSNTEHFLDSLCSGLCTKRTSPAPTLCQALCPGTGGIREERVGAPVLRELPASHRAMDSGQEADSKQSSHPRGGLRRSLQTELSVITRHGGYVSSITPGNNVEDRWGEKSWQQERQLGSCCNSQA